MAHGNFLPWPYNSIHKDQTLDIFIKSMVSLKMSILQIWVNWASKITLKNLQLSSIKIKGGLAPCDVTCSRSMRSPCTILKEIRAVYSLGLSLLNCWLPSADCQVLTRQWLSSLTPVGYVCMCACVVHVLSIGPSQWRRFPVPVSWASDEDYDDDLPLMKLCVFLCMPQTHSVHAVANQVSFTPFYMQWLAYYWELDCAPNSDSLFRFLL